MKKGVKSKQKMQNVSFKDIEEFLEYLPEGELRITSLLRRIIFACLPEVTEKLSYSVPFYKIHKNICFIWPSSILWGKNKTYEGVRMGFSYGYLLTDENSILEKGNRKQVYYLDFKKVSDIDIDLIRSFIYESASID